MLKSLMSFYLVCISLCYSQDNVVLTRYSSNVNSFFPMPKVAGSVVPVSPILLNSEEFKLPCGNFLLVPTSGLKYKRESGKISFYSNYNSIPYVLEISNRKSKRDLFTPQMLDLISLENWKGISTRFGYVYSARKGNYTFVSLAKNNFIYTMMFKSRSLRFVETFSKVAFLIPLTTDRNVDLNLGKYLKPFHLQFKPNGLRANILSSRSRDFIGINHLDLSFDKTYFNYYHYSKVNHLILSNTDSSSRIVITASRASLDGIKSSDVEYYMRRLLEELLRGSKVLEPIKPFKIPSRTGLVACWKDINNQIIKSLVVVDSNYCIQFVVKSKSKLEVDAKFNTLLQRIKY